MKKLILILSLAFFLHLSLSAQSYKMSPLQPQAGESVTIQYDPTGSDLEGLEVNAIVYFIEVGSTPIAHDVAMAKTDSGYTGSFQTSSSAQSLFVKFENEDGSKSDNNHDAGYHSMVYKGAKPVKNAYAASASIYGNYARFYGIKADASKASEIFDKEGLSQEQCLSADYISQYASIARNAKDDETKDLILEHLNKSLNAKNISEKDMTKLGGVARNLKDKALFASYNEKIKANYPDGVMAVNEKYSGFRKLKELDEKLAMYKEAKEKYGKNEDFKNLIERMASQIASAYGEKGDLKHMEHYAGMVSSNTSKAGIYNSLAWKFTGESLDAEGYNLKEGEAISMRSLQLIEKEMATAESKRESYSKKQWARNMKYSYGMYSDTYALLAYKLGDMTSAVKYQAVACETSDMGDAEMNARYAVYIEKAKGAKEAMTYLEDMIAQGKANSAMKTHFTKLFKANVSMDQASEMYMAKLEEKAKAHKIKEIKEEMMNEEAPVFALKNLAGEQVSLESLKGKVVVVDFWATWCGPCKASFPGMQKAVTKYDTADDVAFVFIDTWESGEKKEENAKKFIDGKGYTFNVLMDNDNKMVADYEVNGIPTKFILDKEGNIRFRSSGFNGNDDALVDEISIVVEILRGGDSGNGHTGARP